MQKAKGVAVFALLAVASASLSGCKSDQANRNSPAAKPTARPAKWVAQYRSPRSAGFTGTTLSFFFYSSISVVSSQVVYVAGDMPAGKSIDERVGVVLKTMDGGQSWSEMPIQSPSIQIPTLNDIHFISPDVGWVVGLDSAHEGVLLKTTDAGGSWSTLRLAENQAPTSVFFTDADNGWISGATPPPNEEEGSGGPSAILATTDGGRTWQPQINLSVSIHDLFFLDKMVGWASGSRGTIYHTTDGGRTWNSQRTEIEAGDNIVIPGSEGAKMFRVLGIQFTDADHGFAAAAAEEEETGRVIATSNRGEAWRRQFITADSGIRDIFFLNPDEGWAVTDRGSYVYHTIDGGHSWLSEPKVFEQEVTLVRLGGADASHVWAVGGGAVFFRISE